jgi:hypothetical protein
MKRLILVLSILCLLAWNTPSAEAAPPRQEFAGPVGPSGDQLGSGGDDDEPSNSKSLSVATGWRARFQPAARVPESHSISVTRRINSWFLKLMIRARSEFFDTRVHDHASKTTNH